MSQFESVNLHDSALESEDSFTLGLIESENSFVLGRKTRGFGKNKLVLPGGKNHFYLSTLGIGKVTPVGNVAREIQEETGLFINPANLSLAATLHVSDYLDDTRTIHVLRATQQEIPLQPSDELNPIERYPKVDPPYEKMPADYELWLPHVLGGYTVTAFLETENNKIIESQIFRQQINPLGRMELI